MAEKEAREERIVGAQNRNATPLLDISGLKLDHVTTREELFQAEFQNISKVLLKYILKKPSKRAAPFDYPWLLRLHKEMYGEVWDWAGKLRRTNLNIGVDWHKVSFELHRLLDEVKVWERYSHPAAEISVKLHHRLSWIHPFLNGNGRWARMLTNVYLRQRDMPVLAWAEKDFFLETDLKQRYIKALKKADRNDFSDLNRLHSELSGGN